jgi:1-pyrroline-5-carboxylate dehydrogenase
MANGFFRVPKALNEPYYSYAPGTPERKALKAALAEAKSKQVDIPMTIGGKKIREGNRISIHPPHEIKHTLGHYYKAEAEHVQQAIDAAMTAKKGWEAMPWQDRAAIFLKAAELLTGPYRQKMNAATMLCQSKSPWQAEIEAAGELADFWRFGAEQMTEIYEIQPYSPHGTWNRMEYRPLEGFVFALTPFNFTAIAGNLPSAPAMLGNTVVWKPAGSQVYSAAIIMEVLEEAGLPDGVINMIMPSGPVAGDIIFKHPDFAGLHFTGSTGVFQQLWADIGNNIANFKSYPRIVGETGGKDFVVAHPSADVSRLVPALIRGAFEYQGQKCSAASRTYLPKSVWAELREPLLAEVATIKMGTVENFENFFNAVIDERAFDKIAKYIDLAKESNETEVLAGGNYDKSEGYFIEPTIVLTSNPNHTLMEEEIFGPILTIYVYEDEELDAVLDLVDSTSPYALTGAIFARERSVIKYMSDRLRHTAGNFYINDKPTGAVVGQQPFGGARGSGTNDKAGAVLNLFRWVSARAIKETFNAPTDYRYPFMGEE